MQLAEVLEKTGNAEQAIIAYRDALVVINELPPSRRKAPLTRELKVLCEKRLDKLRTPKNPQNKEGK